MKMTITQQFAHWIAFSPIFISSRKLWELNQLQFNLPLSKFQKLHVGTFLILHDYSEGRFPPTFTDQQKSYDSEINYKYSLPGYTAAEVTDDLMRKPFWFGPFLRRYLSCFMSLVDSLRRFGIEPPQKLLELGCGSGWMAEYLAMMRFDVLGTSISQYEIQDAQLRGLSMKAKQLGSKLEFRTTPMESVDQVVADRIPFDGVYVYEALHHAYNWRQAITASYNCLKPGGWLIIANEPNALHTFISYRVARLSNTHEIGFTQTELIRQLKKVGFHKIKRLKNHFSFYVRPHWLAAQK
jgi:2-polyprenyl-3-methyl-5-hydroxy-6-metoxy-1,4-benzoquinol methylase